MNASLAQRAATLVVAGLLPVALTACGASRDAQTYQARSQAESSNPAVGALAIRGLAVEHPTGGAYAPGDDAEVFLTVTNTSSEDDTLVEASTPVAGSVEVLAGDQPGTLTVPGLGSTGNAVTLRLVGLTAQVRAGEFIAMTLRFAKNGTVETQVPVRIASTSDRPIYTKEKGSEEGEPALQAPTGGKHEEADGTGSTTPDGGEEGSSTDG